MKRSAQWEARGQGAPCLLALSAALERESENAMMMANRFRYIFLPLLSAMMFVFRKDGTAAPRIAALLVFCW